MIVPSFTASLGAADGARLLSWRPVEDLPDPVGLKGMFAGVSNGSVILAGGSNFPVPLRTGGVKTMHADVYVRPLPLDPTKPWVRMANGLERPLAEGAAVTTDTGVVGIGGHDGRKASDDVWLLRWESASRRLERKALPKLPAACANPAAAYADGWIYVAGGETAAGAAAGFHRLNLARALADPTTTQWETLPPLPGRPRSGGILIAMTTPAGERLLLCGGVHSPAKAQDDYLRDAWWFEPETRTWSAAAPMPRGAVLAAAVRTDESTLIVAGGSDGHDFARMKELGERYRIPNDVLVYDSRLDRWSHAAPMPLGVAGAAVVDVRNGWLVAGGEFSPGLRTPRVFLLTVQAKPGKNDSGLTDGTAP